MVNLRQTQRWIHILRRGMEVLMENRARILAYHSISSQRTDLYAIHPHQFERHMQILKTNEMVVVSLPELVDRMQRRLSLRKLVVITFDDGYEDFMEYALPVLQEYDLPATVFVPVAMLGKKSSWSRLAPNAQIMSASQVEQLLEQGYSIGSHSLTHSQLPQLSESSLAEEMLRSRDWLQSNLGLTWIAFAYPFGAFGTRESQMAQMAGYRCAVGFGGLWGNGPETSLFELNRDAIIHGYGERNFLQLLGGWSDWRNAMHWAFRFEPNS